MPGTVNLISRDNGVGLSTDMELLEGILKPAGYDVQRVHWREQIMRLCDIAIFLELYSYRLARLARRKVGVFNLEWFLPSWRAHLPTFNQLWAKNTETHQTFLSLRLTNATLTGFAGRNLHDPAVPREIACFHQRGHSQLKGTEAVVEAWRRHHRELPPLTIVSKVPFNAPPNARVLLYQTREDLTREMNRNMIHLCTSQTEGWGHYIAEALSIGAVVIATDAPPMNEHVRPGWGYLLPARDGGMHDLARLHLVDPDDIAEAVTAAAALPAGVREEMGERAQSHFAVRNLEFAKLALDLIRSLY